RDPCRAAIAQGASSRGDRLGPGLEPARVVVAPRAVAGAREVDPQCREPARREALCPLEAAAVGADVVPAELRAEQHRPRPSPAGRVVEKSEKRLVSGLEVQRLRAHERSSRRMAREITPSSDSRVATITWCPGGPNRYA